MKRHLVLMALAACDSATAEPDAGPVVPFGPPHAAIIQQTTLDPMTSATATIDIAPTAPGSMLVVAVAFEGPPEGIVRSLVSRDRTFEPDTAPFSQPCGRTFQFWSMRDVAAGSSSIELSFNVPVTYRASVFEIGGMGPYPLTAFQGYFITAAVTPPPTIYDAMVPARSGQIVFSAISTCGTLTGLASPSELTEVPALTGTGLAYQLPVADGMFGAHWQFDGADWYMTALGYL